MNPVGDRHSCDIHVGTVHDYHFNCDTTYLKQIRNCILTAGDGGRLSLYRNMDEPLMETIFINKLSSFRIMDAFLTVYNPTENNWKTQNKLIEEEKEVLILKNIDNGPIEYFHRVANRILEVPNQFSQKALHDFCIVYQNFFDYIQNHRSCCQIL